MTFLFLFYVNFETEEEAVLFTESSVSLSCYLDASLRPRSVITHSNCDTLTGHNVYWQYNICDTLLL